MTAHDLKGWVGEVHLLLFFPESLWLAQSVKAKHLQDGDASVLKLLNWPQLLLDLDSAQLAQDQTDVLRRELLASYAERDLKLNSVTEMLRNSRDLLTAVHSKNMKQMGQWGFDVHDPRTTPLQPDAEVQKV